MGIIKRTIIHDKPKEGNAPKRLKGRQLGTAIGEREHQQARRTRYDANFETGLGIVQAGVGAGVAVSGDPLMGSLMMMTAPSGKGTRDKAMRQAAHGTAVESLIAKSRGGSPALGMKGVVPAKQSAADRMRAGASHLGGPKGDAPKRDVASKYNGARTKTGERIMEKARGERMGSKFFKGLGHATQMGSVALGPETAVVGIPAGIASQIVGTSKARNAENLRMQSRGVDNLIMKKRTGSTVGANTEGMEHNWTPKAPKKRGLSIGLNFSGFNRSNANYKPAAPAGGDDGSGKPRKGWSNAARIGAAKARGVQNLPYGGNPGGNNDGTGQ